MVKFIPVNPWQVGMLNSTEDISRYWNTILDTIQEGLMILSPTGRIISMNRAAETITGYKASELVGQSCQVLECTGCKILGKGHGPQWCELFVVGQVESKRCRVTNKGKKQVHVQKKATIIKDEKGLILGAVETLTDISNVVKKEKEIEKLRRSLAGEDGFHGLIGNSSAMHRVFSLIQDAADSEAAVMITGESGTGKELAARAIHKASPRANRPFVKVDCVSLNENVLESELFGHVKGAFTGAERSRTGRFEAARGGDVFLDEIGDIPLSIQVKLLRVLEEKVIERVGENRPIEVDTRIITATNKDLSDLVGKNQFRQDLFYRIAVVPIRLPALRERREDIPLLARAFADHLAVKTGKPIQGFTPEAMARLYAYNWPGNVRELRNAVEYAFVVCREGQINPEHLPETVDRGPVPKKQPAVSTVDRDDEREQLVEALRQAGGNQSQAARILGVSRMTVWKRMKKYGLAVSRDVSS